MGLLDRFRRLLARLRGEPASRGVESLLVRRVRFLGEQEGTPERALKAELSDWFRRDGRIARAYLARGELGGNQATVILGLRAAPGSEEEILAGVRSIFASRFAREQHLDTLFLDDPMTAQIGEVCSPFFKQ